jgi:hypothetical protein
MTTFTEKVEELLPTWFKKIQVTFSGMLPTTDNERQQVFVIPYSMFLKLVNEAHQAEISRVLERVEADVSSLMAYEIHGNIHGNFVKVDEVLEAINKIKGELQ